MPPVLISFSTRLRFGDNNPQDDVGHQPWHTTGQESDKESQAEPESADPKEFTQTPTNSGKHPVAARAT